MTNSNDLHNHFLWATKRITTMLETMSEDQFNKKIHSDNRSIKEIVLHLVSIYAYFSSQAEYKSIVETSKSLEKTSLLELMKELSKKVFTILENEPNKFIPIKTKNGVAKNINGFSLFHMLTDHFAYHRGQIITMFKETTGKEGIGTDYATFLIEDNPDFLF